MNAPRRYPATIKRVIDGDTVDLKVDLGFHVFMDVRFRLARINCPEIGTPEALRAKEFTYEWCHGKALVVMSSKADPYGRWIAELYNSGPNGDVVGLTLSTCLLEAGLAEPYPKPK